MDTRIGLRAWGAGDKLMQQAAQLIRSLEAELSVTDENSEIYALDRDGSARLSDDSAELLQRALELCRETGGALDVTVYPLLRSWGFTTENYRVPSQEEIDGLLRNVDFSRVKLEGQDAAIPEGFAVDLGSVAKGYTGDRLVSLMREQGVDSAIFDLGGNIQTLGLKPDGSRWNIAIQNPEGEGILGVLSLGEKAVVTSGGYERFFVDDDGNLWWHILDPETGYPARNGVISATVVGDEGLRCDALSTALFVMGEEKAESFWREYGDFEMVLITEEGELLITPSLAECFTPSADLAYAVRVLD